MSENYDKLRRPPVSALRQIQAGDLKGKTDINPQWRYEIMDKVFGPCGTAWKYEVVKLWDYPTSDGTVLAFAQVNVFVKDGDKWSDPIPAAGGNTLVDMVKGYEQNGPKRAKPNDEGYKMAITDALGTALKMLGVAADIYSGRWDGAKYADDVEPNQKNVELEKRTVELEALIAGGKFDSENAIRAGNAVKNGNIEKIIQWIDWAKKQETCK